MFFVTLISWLYLIPLELKYYGQNLFSTSVFISNLYFYIVNNDYFSPNTYIITSLSLSLEMQFYFIYPILILIINKSLFLKKRFDIIFFLILVISFLSNIYFSFDEKFVFYLLPTRFWEFLIGYFIFNSIKNNS